MFKKVKNFLHYNSIYFRFAEDWLSQLRNKGFLSAFWKFQWLREAWWEKTTKVKVGEDKYGNTYWESEGTTDNGRQRWVELAQRDNLMFDASRVPSEWHSWLHKAREHPPTPEEIEKSGREVKVEHQKNWTGNANKRYYPPGHIMNPYHKNPSLKKKNHFTAVFGQKQE